MNVLIVTNRGDIIVKLDIDKVPNTVENFLTYVKSGHYDGTVFHRVIKDFMIQGGGFEIGMKQKPTLNSIVNEAKDGYTNVPYTLAMARTRAPNSATAQFFINTNKNSFLDYPGQDGAGYCVFGAVVEGQHVVDIIEATKTTRIGMLSDVPVVDIVIESITIINERSETEAIASEAIK